MDSSIRIGSVVRLDQPKKTGLKWLSEKADLRFPGVIINKNALDYLYIHPSSEMQHEVGGFLLGFPLIDPETGWQATYIDQAIKGKYVSTPTHVSLDPVSFMAVEEERQKTNSILVGYYHSHPNISVFQSGEDVRNFQMYYPENYQIAIVVDPGKTTNEYYLLEHSWIGYFVWNFDHRPTLLQNKNITVVNRNKDHRYGHDAQKREEPVNPHNTTITEIDKFGRQGESESQIILSKNLKFGVDKIPKTVRIFEIIILLLITAVLAGYIIFETIKLLRLMY